MRYIITNLPADTKYHDDMYDEKVKIKNFPYKRKFGDFRIFNGIELYKMDVYIIFIAMVFQAIEEERLIKL